MRKAKFWLETIGYYRLSGYWYLLKSSEASDVFGEDATFELLVQMYQLDRSFRTLAFGATERVEISARSIIIDSVSKNHGSHWYCDQTAFKSADAQARVYERILKETGVTPIDDKRRSQAVLHYLGTYSAPAEPAVWMAFECLSFGAISKCFEVLSTEERKQIALRYGWPHHLVGSWLHCASHLRNVAAHHSRLLDRRFGVAPKRERMWPSVHPKSLQAQFLSLQQLLDYCSPDFNLEGKLTRLQRKYPNAW